MKPIELPTFEATWWPVMLETVPGSGEQITIAHVVRAASGQGQVRQAIPPATLIAMFGSAGKGMLVIVLETVVSLQRQLDQGVRVEKLDAPFGGIGLGARRDCVAHDLNEVFDVAARLGGAFSASQFGSVEKPSAETKRAFDEWAEKIRDQMETDDGRKLLSSFNVAVNVMPSKRSHVGFLHGDYAANFGVLRPGRTISSDTRALKVKLFDLEVLKRGYGLIVQRAEVIVGCPDSSSDSLYSRREVDGLQWSWEFIDREARQRGIAAVRCVRAAEAANHLKVIAA